ncbi:uncharacterized protein EDB91DRAFT_1101181 [Suillus paluster]|uniref:uncharacterized protein n=1 Tax=Suillus paluster TaxID=48578 RepID=UPI001B879D4B|nr:uncharacterized protein EDB91DRAFT_1101181 [Suillus paluster]KAG1754016.1 hypothetical protein EDB91DRAFT_1101181 [Suillus paluster]
MPEIIDLTVSPRLPEPIEILSDGEIPPVSPNQEDSSSQKTRRRPRKRKKSKGPTCDGVDRSRNQSLERRSTADSRVETVSRRRSASPKRRSPTPRLSDQELFFFDAAPAPVVTEPTQISNSQPESSKSAADRLLLPSHVSVLSGGEEGAVAVDIIPPLPVDSEEEDYIEYLDYEDRKAPGLVRYFEAEAEEAAHAKPSRSVCKNCGAEGEHKTYQCPVQVCLTCGTRDEHSTRSCPISKTCYTCGMKGHINKTCPNRFSRSRLAADADDGCDRCGSQTHKMNECPTLWRIYQYVADEDRVNIMQTREEKKKLALGNGGEGYIALEECCYNCGNSGHLGDDCDEVAFVFDIPAEPSAFSSHNIMSGPFYDPASEPVRVRRGPRESQNEDDRPALREDWGMDAPVNVGKQGKNKDKEKLAKRFREQEDDDTGDWFNNPRNMKNRGNDKPASNGRKAIKFGNSMKDVGRQFMPLQSATPRKSLLDRLGDSPHRGHRRRSGDHYGSSKEPESYRIRGASHNSRDRDGEYSRSNSGRERERQRRDSREWDRDRDRGHGWGNEPRYKGGYSR